MNILFTGSTGFIGSSVTYQLIHEGHQLICISRKKELGLQSPSITYLNLDLATILDQNKLPKNIDCIIHAAATMEKEIDENIMYRINTQSTADLLAFGKKQKIKKFIFISSGGVYGYSRSPLSENKPPKPVNFYGLSKLQSELLVNYYSKYFSTVNLRLFFPYGSHQIKGIIPQLTLNIKNDQDIIIYNEGTPVINPIHITDVTQSIKRSLSLSGKHTINICGDETISIKNLAELLGNHLKNAPKFKYATDRKIKNLIGINHRMKKHLRIEPTVSLEEGIKNFIIFHEKHPSSHL